jgi:hypothetical protein
LLALFFCLCLLLSPLLLCSSLYFPSVLLSHFRLFLTFFRRLFSPSFAVYDILNGILPSPGRSSFFACYLFLTSLFLTLLYLSVLISNFVSYFLSLFSISFSFLHLLFTTVLSVGWPSQRITRSLQIYRRRAILETLRVSAALLQICTIFTARLKSPFPLHSIVQRCFSPRDNDEQICVVCPPTPPPPYCNCLSIIPAEHIARAHASSPWPQFSTLPHDAPHWNNSRIEFGPSEGKG